jgi:hypothetical protein
VTRRSWVSLSVDPASGLPLTSACQLMSTPRTAVRSWSSARAASEVSQHHHAQHVPVLEWQIEALSETWNWLFVDVDRAHRIGLLSRVRTSADDVHRDRSRSSMS